MGTCNIHTYVLFGLCSEEQNEREASLVQDDVDVGSQSAFTQV